MDQWWAPITIDYVTTNSNRCHHLTRRPSVTGWRLSLSATGRRWTLVIRPLDTNSCKKPSHRSGSAIVECNVHFIFNYHSMIYTYMLIIKYRKGAEAREKRAIYKYKGRLQNFVPFYRSPGQFFLNRRSWIRIRTDLGAEQHLLWVTEDAILQISADPIHVVIDEMFEGRIPSRAVCQRCPRRSDHLARSTSATKNCVQQGFYWITKSKLQF